MVLRAVVGDLERTHERGDAAGGRPIKTPLQTEQQAAAIGIAATRRVGELFGFDRRYFVHSPTFVDVRTLRTAGHDDGTYLGSNLFERPTRTFHQQTGLVIIDRDPTCLTKLGTVCIY